MLETKESINLRKEFLRGLFVFSFFVKKDYKAFFLIFFSFSLVYQIKANKISYINLCDMVVISKSQPFKTANTIFDHDKCITISISTCSAA